MDALRKCIPEFQEELINIFQYWSTEGINQKTGLFYGRIDHFGNKDPYANMGIIMYTRQLWAFSAAAQHFNSEEYAAIADGAFVFLQNHFLDVEFGGYFWETNSEGVLIDDKKQTYAQAFALYAITEYYKLTKKQEVLNLAHAQFNCIIDKCFDSENGGFIEGFTREWAFDKNNRLSEKDSFAEKSMNTNLHILEAFTLYYEVFKTESGADALKRVVLDFAHYIIGADKHVILFMTKEWQAESKIHSYGHDIEASWLLWEAVEVLDDKVLKDFMKVLVLDLADVFVREGIDKNNAVIHEANIAENTIDTDRHWWPQCEAMEGLANAYNLTGKAEYALQAVAVWGYIKANVLDKANGEWYTILKADEMPNTTENKGGMWKTPYHNGRALMRLIQRFSK